MPTPPNGRNDPLKSGGRFCLYCRKPIDHLKASAQYCCDSHRFLARDKRKGMNRPFIGLDGEGIENNYILLAAKNKNLPAKSISNPQGLSTIECLDFLLSLPKGSKSGTKPLYVWFAFDYDVNMILGDLPLKGETESIEELRRDNVTHWNGYRITYIPRKIFKVSKDGKFHHSTDVWSFFASTFERALEIWNVELPKIITEGKAAREDFSTWELKDIQAYNEAELDALAELCEQLRNAINPLKLTVQSWHGPGALAAAFLSKNKAKKYLGDTPNDLYEAATRAYFGGRIDAAGYGVIEPVYHYDLVSAYPSGIRFLPDLSCVKWFRCKGKPHPDSTLYLAKVRWSIPETRWGVLPWRSKQGIIRFPRQGEGYYWSTEFEAARDRFPGCFEIIECFYTTDKISLPFKELIEEAFAYRAELKAKGHPSNLAVKLILNSLYGKFAQTVGKAQYYSPIWAGLITAHTRAAINRVITDDVVCTMTDSIWSSEPLTVPTSNELGGWEPQDETVLILAEAGLYEATTPDGKKFLWQRGFDKRMPVDIPGIVDKWLGPNPAFMGVYNVKRFIGMGLASMTSYPWRHWIDLERKIQPVPLVGTTKRIPLYPIEKGDQICEGFQPLKLKPADEFVCSYPYSKLTLDAERLFFKLTDECAESVAF